MRMNRNRFAKQIAAAAGFFLLGTAPGLARAQSSPPSPPPTSHKAAPVVRPKKPANPMDDFAGVEYSDEQKAKIAEIHKNTKMQKDNVVNDQKLTVEQRDAMIEGYDRIERGQIYKALTTEQQKKVRENIRARHLADQQEKKKASPPK
jgi:Spy/CpxP family protein refolding chaperone